MPGGRPWLPFRDRRRVRGIYTAEFVLVLLVFLPLVFTTVEVGRLALANRVLALATHRAALAAGREPADCERAARTTIEGDRLARWLFDRNNDGRIGFVSGADPLGTPTSEIRLEISADDGDVANGIAFDTPLCGGPGSWISVRAAAPSARWTLLGDVMLRQESWAVNQA